MNALSSRVKSDFNRARFHAVVHRIWAILSGRPVDLLSFEEIKKHLRIGVPVYRGMSTVKLEQVVGSLNRHHEFDRAFRPSNLVSSQRWQRVDRAFHEGISLPAVILYQVGEAYFVVDGHHRVSVALRQGQVFIDAEVREWVSDASRSQRVSIQDLNRLAASPA